MITIKVNQKIYQLIKISSNIVESTNKTVKYYKIIDKIIKLNVNAIKQISKMS